MIITFVVRFVFQLSIFNYYYYYLIKLFLIIGILTDEDKVFQDWRKGDVLLGGQFSTFSVSNEDGRGVRLKAGDSFGLPGLTDHFNGLTDSNQNW